MMTDFAQLHPDAYLLLAEGASNNDTMVDADLLALLAEVAGVQSLETAVEDLEAAGFAARYDDDEIILHIEPLRVLRESGGTLSTHV